MARGYLEGPASEEREAALERGDHLEREQPRERRAFVGSTADDPERNDKLAILCELLLNHPAADALKPPKKRSQRKVR